MLESVLELVKIQAHLTKITAQYFQIEERQALVLGAEVGGVRVTDYNAKERHPWCLDLCTEIFQTEGELEWR